VISLELVYMVVTTVNTVLGVIRTVQKDALYVQIIQLALNVKMDGLVHHVDNAQNNARNASII
jgi:hypothetical protein